MTPLVLTVAPNGARKTKADHPTLPIVPEEIARTARDCRDAGAAMIHLHVRDEAGRHSLDVERYRSAIAAIRNSVGDDLIIQATSEAAGVYKAPEQMAMVRELKPEAVSLAIREIAPDGESEAEAGTFFSWIRHEQIMAQYILYSAEDLIRFLDLAARGIVPGNAYSLLFVLGRYSADLTSDPNELRPFLDVLDQSNARERILWSVCAFGPRECAVIIAAATLGGHGRIGFENNLCLSDGTQAADNRALVEQTAAAARLIGRPPATPEEARGLFASLF